MPYADPKRQKQAVREHYLNNKGDWITRRQIQRHKRIEWLGRIKSLHSCAFCPESENCCLDFHHADETTKVSEVTKMAKENRKPSSVLAEMKKCVLLCANCHRKVHAGILRIRGLPLFSPPVDALKWLNVTERMSTERESIWQDELPSDVA